MLMATNSEIIVCSKALSQLDEYCDQLWLALSPQLAAEADH